MIGTTKRGDYLRYVAVKVPEVGDVSKSARFFGDIVEAVDYADKSPYPDMAVAIVLQKDNWGDRLMVWLVRRVLSKLANGSKVPAVS